MQKALETLIVKQAVAEVVQRWGRARDQGLWDDLAATFHPGGTIKVMWFEGRHEDFIAACAKRFTPGVGSTKHFFGMPVVEVNGARALAETAAQISMSGTIADAQFISQSFVRFLDRFEPRNGEWRMVQRHCIYEGDRFLTDRPVELDARILAMWKPPFRYLAYRQHLQGLTIDPETPMDGTPSLERLMRDARAWIAGGA